MRRVPEELEIARRAMAIAYAPLKLLPTRLNKVVMLSRQENSTPFEFEMIRNELTSRHPEVEVVEISQRLEEGVWAKTEFFFALWRSLYHLATSKVCVLDSYWPAVSALEHKADLVVFQMWHSMGKIKQSGKKTVGKEGGRKRSVARIMRIHDGYDYVIAGGSAWNQFYRESFGVSDAAILNIGLPRADCLVNDREEIADRIYAKYPELREGPVVLYAPTFRRGQGSASAARRVVSRLGPAGFKVIVRGHANQPLLASSEGHWSCPEFRPLELLTVADFLVTDYSAIAVEGALAGVPTFYYVYDLPQYKKTTGLNIDLEKELPGLTYRSTAGLLRAMNKPYPSEVFETYRSKYLFDDPGHSTADLVCALEEKGGLCTP